MALDIGMTIRERRRALGLSQSDVAFTAGVNRRVIGELERGKETVRLDVLRRVAEALGLDLTFVERT